MDDESKGRAESAVYGVPDEAEEEKGEREEEGGELGRPNVCPN